MAERGQPVLSLISRVFLNDGGGIIERLARAGHGRLASYAVQQIGRFQRREDFALQHADSGNREGVEDDVLTEILGWAFPEQRMRGLSPEEILRGLPAEEVLRALPPEDRVRDRRSRNGRPTSATKRQHGFANYWGGGAPN